LIRPHSVWFWFEQMRYLVSPCLLYNIQQFVSRMNFSKDCFVVFSLGWTLNRTLKFSFCLKFQLYLSPYWQFKIFISSSVTLRYLHDFWSNCSCYLKKYIFKAYKMRIMSYWFVYSSLVLFCYLSESNDYVCQKLRVILDIYFH